MSVRGRERVAGCDSGWVWVGVSLGVRWVSNGLEEVHQ